MRLRAATVDNVKALLAVQQACAEAPQWSEALWAQTFAGAHEVLLVEGDEGVSGFVVVSIVAGTAELENIAVLQRARRQGVGHMLCENAFSWARKQGADAMQLEVRASNEAALRLYDSLGFCEQGRRLKYYRDPVDDAVLMRLSL